MNKELELEAEKYSNELIEFKAIDKSEKTFIESVYKYVVTTSKYVEKQKLEFAIEQLGAISEVHSEPVMSQRAKGKIKELEQKLSEL